MSDPDALFARIVDQFSGAPGVTPPIAKGGSFGRAALKVNGKIFAFLSKGDLVVKLPRERVDELIRAGTGKTFDAGRGKVMKEWVAVGAEQARRGKRLSEESRAFVSR
jgi:hypothetical protein